ncbi:CU044_5270 family protein [Actinomadura opuntiae]|uniref:CU044_5270 family protein n=1 Tax=Actinomadura sp. OS1-43 TaxID=604315 RepID=UPI00255AE349|nr:CU044_5270 family protein [Actinomadura sp. OS1-43]MDL4813379.1 CU044_5270 family protein [Actinomadura sp. OS1-43]
MKHDVMEALAAARPAQLDPPADPAAARARRERDLGRAFRADAAPAGERTRGRRPVIWALTGVVAAGAAAAVGIATIGSSGSPDSPGGSRPSGTIDLNKQAVLAAATKAELAPIGRYWYTDQLDGQSYIVQAKTGAYAIVGAQSESFSWHGAKSGMGEGYYLRDLPARPPTPRDAALWRKAGSPSSFRVRTDGGSTTYTTKVTKWRSDGPEAGIDARGGGDFLGKSAEELRKLPTDPSALARLFLSDAEMGKSLGMSPASGRKPSAEQAADAKIWRVASLLGGSPMPPKVRAGLMRALAAQPGVQAIGHVTDPLGRRGVALASAERTTATTDGPKGDRGAYRSRDVIVFDERTGALLSVQDTLTRPGGEYAGMKPGFIINYSATRSTNWTDTKPKPPAKLPF